MSLSVHPNPPLCRVKHRPVWKEQQLRSKSTWVGSLECLQVCPHHAVSDSLPCRNGNPNREIQCCARQYYATVDHSREFSIDNICWLSHEHIDERSEPPESLAAIQEMMGSGQSVGGVVNSATATTEQVQGAGGE